MSRRRAMLLIALLGIMPWRSALADLVVVVNARSAIETLTRDQITNIFLGRYRQLPSGIIATPVDQPADSPEKTRFYRLLVNKDLTEIDAYWARLVFSGKTPPPHQASNGKAVVQWLLRDKGTIAYMERAQVESRFRIVHSLEP
jgi:ABC-type phosphate transport system substrate-binding protein